MIWKICPAPSFAPNLSKMSVDLPKLGITLEVTGSINIVLYFVKCAVIQSGKALNRPSLNGIVVWHRTTLMTVTVSTMWIFGFSWALTKFCYNMLAFCTYNLIYTWYLSIYSVVIIIVVVDVRGWSSILSWKHNELLQ